MQTTPDIETIHAGVREAIAEVAACTPEELADTTRLDDLGIDSLLVVEVVVGTRRRFGVDVPPAAFRTDLRTVADLVAVIGDHVAGELGGAPAARAS